MKKNEQPNPARLKAIHQSEWYGRPTRYIEVKPTALSSIDPFSLWTAGNITLGIFTLWGILDNWQKIITILVGMTTIISAWVHLYHYNRRQKQKYLQDQIDLENAKEDQEERRNIWEDGV